MNNVHIHICLNITKNSTLSGQQQHCCPLRVDNSVVNSKTVHIMQFGFVLILQPTLM